VLYYRTSFRKCFIIEQLLGSDRHEKCLFNW